MIKKLFTLIAVVLLFAVTTNAQWSNLGAWPDTSYTGGTHGIAVDPDGKVWVSSYYKDVKWATPDGDTLDTSGILVFNADGTEAPFSPITTVSTGGGFVIDTLHGNCRGLETDAEGNILYVQSGPSKMIKIDYKTGEGLASALIPETGSSPTGPAVDAEGNIYVGPVVGGPGTAICQYDGGDLSYLGNVVDGPLAISRTMEISADANTIYWTAFTAGKCYVYSREDEFSDYALTDSLFEGMWIETAEWNNDILWVSHDSRGEGYTHMMWYGYDPATNAIVDSLSWSNNSVDNGGLPRGLDFSNDGTIAYIGSFGTGDARIEKVMFGTPANVNLKLQVDMTAQIGLGNFDPASDVVRCAGAMQGWSPADAPDMTDADGDNIYEVTYSVEPNATYEYKFLIGTEWGGDEGFNRSVTVGYSDLVVDPVYFNDQAPVSEQKEMTVIYTADMEFEIVSGRFDPVTDTLELRGVKFGWGPGVMMEQSTLNPNHYEYIDTDTLGVGQDLQGYKFYYTPGIWEGGDNKTHTVTQEEYDAGVVELVRKFNDATLETVTNNEVVVTFVCNTDGAISSANNAAFTEVNTVHLTGAVPPLTWPDGGWPNDQIDRMIAMYDDGATGGDEVAGDKIFTTQVKFPKYSPLRIQYKYGINYGDDATNQGGNDNENGVGADHFIDLSPEAVEVRVENNFGEMGDHEVTSVEEIPGVVPTAYELEQNYPNPFNPSTMIRFSIPESNTVTLKIYNMLGQEVAELLNEYKSVGKYEVSFDASKLSSGMYIYAIQSGSYTATKKMMLIK